MSNKIVEALEIGLSFAMQESMARHGGPVSRSVALIESALAEARAAPAAEPVVRIIREKDGSLTAKWGPGYIPTEGDRLFRAPPPVEASKPSEHEPEWTLWQFQHTDGTWSQFMNERHYAETAKSGEWNMRRIARVEASKQQAEPASGEVSELRVAAGIASETIPRITSEWCESYACEKLGGALQKQRCLQSDGQPCFCWRAAGE